MTTIDLKNQLQLLKSLQDIDVELHKIEVQLAQIPVLVNEAAYEFNQAKTKIEQKASEKQALEKRRKDEETYILDETARVKERETKLYAIKTNKEYQAAIKEIADAKQALKDREDSLLRLMELLDTINQEITQLSAGLADKEKVFTEKEAEIRKGEGELHAACERLKAESTKSESGVDPKILKEYRFIQRRISDAMALAVGGVCQGCNKKIQPQLYIELMKWQSLISCPNCHRLLFYREEEQAS